MARMICDAARWMRRGLADVEAANPFALARLRPTDSRGDLGADRHAAHTTVDEIDAWATP